MYYKILLTIHFLSLFLSTFGLGKGFSKKSINNFLIIGTSIQILSGFLMVLNNYSNLNITKIMAKLSFALVIFFIAILFKKNKKVYISINILFIINILVAVLL